MARSAFGGLGRVGAKTIGNSAEKSGVSGIGANKLAGDSMRNVIAAREAPALIEQSFSTVGGVRRVDILKLGKQTLAIESKVGITALDSRVRQELARDWWLSRQGQVGGVRWEFSPSRVTGEVGPHCSSGRQTQQTRI
jgi:hypothetical protein